MENEKVFIKTEENDSDGVVSSPLSETVHIKTER
jgi:hypothetical protein